MGISELDRVFSCGDRKLQLFPGNVDPRFLAEFVNDTVIAFDGEKPAVSLHFTIK